MNRPVSLFAFLMLTLSSAAVTAQARVAPMWPAPPETARIRYLGALNPDEMRRPPSALTRVLRALVGAQTSKPMAQPYGIAIGSDRRVYVADSVGGVIHVFDNEKSGYSTIKVDAESLIGIAIVGEQIFVTDSVGGRLLCIDRKGRVLWRRDARDGFRRPTGIAASNSLLYVVDTLANTVRTVGLNGTMFESFGRRGTAPGEFNFPTNISRLADGRLLVTDTLNFRVQILNREGVALGSFGRLGDAPGDFDKPKGIASDSQGHVYVVEGLNDVVQVFDTEGRLLLTFGSSGNGPGEFWLPSGITIVNDVVYVADAANHRVQMFQYLTPQ